MSKVFFSLAGGNFLQDWSDSSQITANNDWSNVPSIVGYLGDNASTTTAGIDPRTITSDASLGQVDVLHDIATTSTTGGVGEFSGLTNPTIGLQGSGTADAPSIVLYLNSAGRNDLHLDVDIRHLDADVTTQQFDIQYRVGDTGAWTNLPGGYIADATAASTGGLTHLSLDLPDALSNQPQVELRFMTTNAPSNDEWLGVDNISVTSGTAPVDTTPPTLASASPGPAHLAATDANLTLTFSESVKAGAGSFSIVGDAGDVHTISAADTSQVTFAGTTVTINPTADLNASEHYHLAVDGAAVTDTAGNAYVGTNDATDFTTASPTPHIYDIQGASQTSPYDGLQVTTSGVVTAVDTTGSKGFWIQDPTGDGNAATSDAVFVFTGTTPTVTVGHLIQVSGTVDEFQGSDANNLPITEINTTAANITDEGVGPAITPTIIGDGGLHAPTNISDDFATYDPAHNAVDFYESLEGMVVTVKNAEVTTETFDNETYVVPDNGTSSVDANDRGGVTIGPNDMTPQALEVFTDSGVSPITLNNVAGDHLGDVTGVISYFGGDYELIPTSVGSTASTGAVPRETTALTGDAAHLTIGEYNLDNLDGSDPTQAARIDSLASDIVHNLGAPDIMGLEEIADNVNAVAAGSTDLSGTATLQKLVDAIAAAGGPHYQFAEIAPTVNGANGGEPNGNIRQAFLYDPTKVTLVNGSLTQIQDDNPANGDAYTDSRHPLVGQFVFNGQTVTVVDVHDSARSGSDENFGVDQPPINSDDQKRTDQTAPIEHFVQQQEATNPNADIIVTGDFNGFQFETAQTQLTTGGALTNLDTQLDPTDRYSYNFDGSDEQIDQMFASPNLTNGGAQFDIVHLNTGAPDATRDTDHDPTLGRYLIDRAPTAVNDTATASDHQAVTINVTANDTDPDTGDTQTVTSVSATTAGGHVSIVNNQVVYTADADSFDQLAPSQHATDSFTYVIQDLGGETSSATVTVTVNGIAAGPNQTGTAGDDSITGTIGNETINGGSGNDTIDAGSGADTVAGGVGNDVVIGGSGADNLSGGDGNDTLTGGPGNDVLGGGRGNDLFVFGQNFGHDVVGDYQAGADHIEFQGLGFSSFQDVMSHATQSGVNVIVTDAAGDTLQINNTTIATLNAHSGDFLFA